MTTKKVLMYQFYPRCWGKIEMMTRHLRSLKDLGFTHVWLSPVYISPDYDHGYDVSDYFDIDEKYGTMEDFDRFVRTAHVLKLKVVLDLVVNHTSIFHPWMKDYPDFYIWRDQPNGWTNWFDGQSAWAIHDDKKQYYCHMFSAEQADLNWFPDNENINTKLLSAFESVKDFWIAHGVDGFRLDAIQAVNKDYSADNLDISQMFIGEKAVKVINALFPEKDEVFVLMECLDPTPTGEVVRYYMENSNITCCNNILLKDDIDNMEMVTFKEKCYVYCQIPGFMLELESHDSPRFTSRSREGARQIIQFMFTAPVDNICIYNGQELGLKNPTKEELSDARMCQLDVQTKMRFENGESMDDIRPTSRANARVRYPLSEFLRQKKVQTSNLRWFRSYSRAFTEN